MLQTAQSTRGMVVAPHHLASQAGLRVLQEGGNAIEAIIAAAATIAVAYPHMNALGGDNFWLISAGGPPVGIDACGAATVDIEFYRAKGLGSIPARGPLAANTVAGAVSGWQAALALSARWGGNLPLARLFEDAIYHAGTGIPVSRSQHRNTVDKLSELKDCPGFAATFLVDGSAPPVGSLFKEPGLAQTFKMLAARGLDDFYRGELAGVIAADLARLGSPVSADDLARHHAIEVTPLNVRLANGTAYNMPPPTQGLTSLMLLALFERMNCGAAETFDYLHGLVEATKCAFRVRDLQITDPNHLDADPAQFLTGTAIDSLAASIDPARAAPWPDAASKGDTVWLGAIDRQGRAVSFIQSIYWEFGSGVVLPETGILWQNRGTSFTLDPAARNPIERGRRPFHTIQPAMALLDDGRVMAYGTMGGDGQPQTQAALYTRYVTYGQGLQTAITAPRWLLGRTWGAETTNLRIENRFENDVVEAMRATGHDVELVGPFDEIMGHAGALVRHPSGVIEGAADPRGDGIAAGF